MKNLFLTKLLVLTIIYGISLYTNICNAQTINVPEDYETIQEAINHASDNDTILVSPGTYYEYIVINNKNLVIGSLFLTTNNEDYIDQTIIDGSENARVVLISEVEEPSLFTGFTIQNGFINDPNQAGAGINVSASNGLVLSYLKLQFNSSKQMAGGLRVTNSNVNIIHSEFSNNIAIGSENPPISGMGGALYAYNSQIWFENCDFLNNIATIGGGVLEQQCTNNYLNCSFIGNTATDFGAGVGTKDCITEFNNCYFDDNSGDGAIYPEDTDIKLNNCLLTNNDVAIMGADSINLVISNTTIANNKCTYTPIWIHMTSNIYIYNSILWNNCNHEIWLSLYNNLHVSNSTLRNGIDAIDTASVGNNIYWYENILSANPYFIDSTDYHLSDYSNCIGAGIDSVEMNNSWFYSTNYDFENNPRPSPSGSFSDLGAYENPLGNPVSVSEKNKIDKSDFSIYPNPAKNTLYISSRSDKTISKFVIYNQLGQKLLQQYNNTSRIDISRLRQGIYIIELTSEESIIRQKLLIKQ